MEQDGQGANIEEPGGMYLVRPPFRLASTRRSGKSGSEYRDVDFTALTEEQHRRCTTRAAFWAGGGVFCKNVIRALSDHECKLSRARGPNALQKILGRSFSSFFRQGHLARFKVPSVNRRGEEAIRRIGDSL